MLPRGNEAARDFARTRAQVWSLRLPALLVLMSCLALGLGLLVYLADRHAADSLLWPRFAARGTGPLFGVIGQWLPSFVHPFAFSLLSAAAMRRPLSSARAAYSICALWWAVNLAFELGQHSRFSAPIAEALQFGLGQNALTMAISRYLLRGRFDWGDVMALSVGALAAAAVLWLLRSSEDRHDA